MAPATWKPATAPGPPSQAAPGGARLLEAARSRADAQVPDLQAHPEAGRFQHSPRGFHLPQPGPVPARV